MTSYGKADFPGLYGDVTSDVITYSNGIHPSLSAMNPGGFYYTPPWPRTRLMRWADRSQSKASDI